MDALPLMEFVADYQVDLFALIESLCNLLVTSLTDRQTTFRCTPYTRHHEVLRPADLFLAGGISHRLCPDGSLVYKNTTRRLGTSFGIRP